MGLKHLAAGNGHTAANLGLGVNTMATEQLSVFVEAAVYAGLDKSFTDVGAKLGLRYHFAQNDSVVEKVMPAPAEEQLAQAEPTPKPEPVPVDSDNDGVIDDEDLCPDSDPKYAVDANGCVVLESFDVSIQLQIPFANNSDVVEPQYFSEIKRVADFMAAHPEGGVEIAGHTSARGDDAYNLDLSSRRAKAVADILVTDYGVARERVTHKGYGETRLLNTSGTDEAARINRRIEAIFSATEQRKKTALIARVIKKPPIDVGGFFYTH